MLCVFIYILNADLGGLVVSVLATGPKVRGFDPDRGRWIFKGDKNPAHNFLTGMNSNSSKIQAAISLTEVS
jgi:hypothetical protein